MGCTASKLDNEDTVRRCKERRRLIKDAVFARHHLAAAHADYCRSLRFTGVALSDFAAGEPLLIVSPSTPSVLLHHHNHHHISSPSSSTTTFRDLPKPPPIKTTPLYQPPQPPPPPSPPPPPYEATNISNAIERKPKPRKSPKLPHILSDSSVSSATPRSFIGETTYVGIPNTNYASTPSQASSVWNWDNFYPPPSPPGSDFFHHKGDKVGRGGGGYNGHFEDVVEERESEREEVHCSEWGDHYSTSTTSDEEEDDDIIDHHSHVDGDDERDSRSEISELRTRSHFGSSSVRSEPVGPPPVLKKVVEETSEDGRSTSSSRSWKNNNGGGGGGKEMCGSEEMRVVVRHKDLKEIVGSLKEYFDKAAQAGDQVSEMLETGRAQLDRSFRQLKSMIILLFQFY